MLLSLFFSARQFGRIDKMATQSRVCLLKEEDRQQVAVLAESELSIKDTLMVNK